MKLLYTAILGLSTLTLFSCHKDNRGLKDPQPLIIMPIHDGARLSDAVLNQVHLYYHINLTSTHEEPVADFGRAPGTGYQKGWLSSSDVAELSGNEDSKFFYLSFPDGSIDTLTVNYEAISEDEAKENPCFCKLPQRSVKINGIPATRIGYDKDSVPVYAIPK